MNNNIVMFGQVSNIYKLYNYISIPQQQPIEILDPLTTIFRFCLLNYKKNGTKIGIYSNRISVQEASFYQGVIRWTNGDERNDLHKLEIPIKKSLSWYIPKLDNNLKFIFELSTKGMEKLQNSYEAGTARVSLEHYVSLINTCLMQGKLASNIDEETDEEDNIMYIKLKNLWSERQILILYDLLKQITVEKSRSQKKCYISAAEKILDGKDFQVSELIKKITTGY